MPQFPDPNPLAQLETPKLQHLPGELGERWRFESAEGLEQIQLSQLPIDHSVRAISQRGGRRTGTAALTQFSQRRLSRYNEERNVPDRSGSSALSPFLHFGHVSSHEVYQAIIDATPDWSLEALGKPNGKMNGFWNLDENSEAFLDQLLTWREIGFNLCSRESNYEAYESLPDWAQKTLAEHETDPRPFLYNLEQFENAKTHDDLWNAAQRQLVREGRMHNYLRMLWGKKILHWTRSPREALSVMIELNNKYALDGRDPNSYSGIFWVLGRYDRAWGPERPVFGKIRYMTSESTRSKVSVKDYLKRYADA
jgi:deoxyribodipyrimidine photo-lyase